MDVSSSLDGTTCHSQDSSVVFSAQTVTGGGACLVQATSWQTQGSASTLVTIDNGNLSTSVVVGCGRSD